DRQTLYAKQAADRHADSVGPVPSSLREDADLRPVGPVAGMARGHLNVAWGNEVEEEQHLDVRETRKADQGLRSKLIFVDGEGRNDFAPAVIDWLLTRRLNHS